MKHTPSKHSEPLSMTFPSLYSFFKDMTVLGTVLLLVFMCENFPLNPQGHKEWDRDMYYFLCLLLLVVSLCNIKKVRRKSGRGGAVSEKFITLCLRFTSQSVW